MFNPFETRDSNKEPVNNLYSVYDGEDKKVKSLTGCTLLEFTLFIEGMGLEEAAEYSLVPVGKRWGE